MVEPLSVFHGFVFLGEKPELKAASDSKEDVQILIRLDRGFFFLRKPRCTVTIRHPGKSACSGAETFKSDSDLREQRSADQDYKLPFWIE